jgi:O-antigen/teichoic acid export membrane protein
MMRVPLALVGQSIGQVFFNRCSEMYNRNNSIFPLVIKTMRTLFLIGFIPFMVLFFWGEPLFQFMFGNGWSESGRIVEILAITLFLNFIISPISTIPIILNKQRPMFVIGIIAGVFHLISFGLFPYIWRQLSFREIVMINAMLISVLNLLTGIIYFQFAKKN